MHANAIDFNDIHNIKEAGFIGFKTIGELYADSSLLPKLKGVYLIINLDGKPRSFLTVGTGGHFKGRNPNISITELNNNWVENSKVVYIGKAGKDGSKATLKSRLRQYIKFGNGKDIGHWGGRLIWQFELSQNLVVCWKHVVDEDPRDVERTLIESFILQFGFLPFANLKG